MQFNLEMGKAGCPREFSGEMAFKLYDTYGFPLDLTELMARERGLTVDVAGFEKLMEQQRERARKAQKKEEITVEQGELKAAPTRFLGYDFLEAEAVVETVLPGKTSDELNIIVDRTPLYAEMGGQVGDRGLLHVPGHDWTEVGQLRVVDTQKRGDVFVHRAALVKGRAPEPGEAVRISVDADRRNLIQGHHTVTHLLHWALHEVVSKDASQKGSYVGPDKLTFDFSSAPLTSEQKRDVEKLVNEKIAENASVSWTEIPFGEAKQRKDIIQFFGEKYGDTVRVLQIGGVPHALDGYSMELCGGTHVRSTGEIGPFRIVREEAIAAGTRRIEAVAGDAAGAWAREEAARQQEKFEALARKKPDIPRLPAFETNGDTAEILKQIDARAVYLEKIAADVRDWEKKTAKTGEAELQKPGCPDRESVGGVAWRRNFLRRRSGECRCEVAAGCRGRTEAKIRRPNFSCGRRRRKRCTDRCCSERTHREISGEQTDPADRANRERKRRRASGKRARRRQGPEQGRGSAGKSERTSELRRTAILAEWLAGILPAEKFRSPDGKRPLLDQAFQICPVDRHLSGDRRKKLTRKRVAKRKKEEDRSCHGNASVAKKVMASANTRTIRYTNPPKRNLKMLKNQPWR